MSSITKSIQNEYVLLMENAFSEKYKYAFRNLELKELRRFILKELISSPELDNQLTNMNQPLRIQRKKRSHPD